MKSITARYEFDRNIKSHATRRFLCTAVLCVAFSLAQAETVEWHFLNYLPPPASFVITPASPAIGETINFVSPANGEVYLNSIAAADAFGNPLLSVDSVNLIVTVTFTPPLNEPIPNIADPVGGVDGNFVPLNTGTWSFQILSNSFTFTVTGPSLEIVSASNQILISWTALVPDYILQTSTNLSAGSWNNITNGISNNGTNYVFTNSVSSQAAFYRLKQQ